MSVRYLNRSCNELPKDYSFYGIDILKFICSFMVCAIHIQPFNSSNLEYLNFWLQDYLFRIAVPFYFVASGFLLFRKIDCNNINTNRIKDYCLKMIRLLGTWSFLLFIGRTAQLWYLGAVILAVLVLSILIKKKVPFKYIVTIAVILFIIGLLGNSYYGLIEPFKQYTVSKILILGYESVFPTSRNGLVFGLIFVLMGVVFSQRRIVISFVATVTGLVFSLLLMFLEVFLLRHYSTPKGFDIVVSLLPVTFFLFYLSTHIILEKRSIYKSLRIIGTLIYFTHFFVNYFIVLVVEILKNRMGVNLMAYQFVITICFSTLLAIIIERLSRKEKYGWLKYLYS